MVEKWLLPREPTSSLGEETDVPIDSKFSSLNYVGIPEWAADRENLELVQQ